MELEPQLVRAYAETFIPRWDRYAFQRPDGRYIQVKKPLTLEHVIAHLTAHHRGEEALTLGAYALAPDSTARWVCLDADDAPQWRQVWYLAQALQGQGVPGYAEPSRRGGHLWLFTPRLSGADARAFGQHLLDGHDIADVELFPKQEELRSGPGSLVRLPLGVHQKTGRVYPFVDLAGEPLAPTIREQMVLLANPARVPQAFIDRILAEVEAAKPESPPLDEPTFDTSPAGGETLSERIKRSISVYDFVSQYVELDHQGRAFCPFHDDQVKSFSVNREAGYWHCFAGCGGGSVIDFAIKWRELHGQDPDITATIKALAETLL